MPYDFREFLALAEELARRDSEAAHRSAISRAYYAVYHESFRSAVARTQRLQDFWGQHKRFWDEMKRREPALATIAEAGEALRQVRSSADYDRPHPFSPGEARQQAIASVQRARLVLQELDRLR